jgi:hypothetical protein
MKKSIIVMMMVGYLAEDESNCFSFMPLFIIDIIHN